jgi:hypothetical protein
MSIERTYYCDGPHNPDLPGDTDLERCPGHVTTMTPPPYLPIGFLRVSQGAHDGTVDLHFCCWNCVLRYAATVPPPTIITLADLDDEATA